MSIINKLLGDGLKAGSLEPTQLTVAVRNSIPNHFTQLGPRSLNAQTLRGFDHYLLCCVVRYFSREIRQRSNDPTKNTIPLRASIYA
jgi:hypothetical protein